MGETVVSVTDSPPPGLVGAILAGGRARRLGGRDKALLELAGVPLVVRLAERLAPQVGELLLNANGEAGCYAPFGLPVVPDARPGFPGPLAGLEAVLAHLPPGTPWLLTVPVDLPFLPPDLVARLWRAGGGEELAVACRHGAITSPLAALWPVASTLARVRPVLDRGERRVNPFFAGIPHRWLELPPGPGGVDPLFNLNAPEDLERAGAWLGVWGGAFPSPSG